MRLIDADKLNIYDVSPAYGMCVMGVTQEDIDDAPTVDAEPVIRCKDCKHWNEYYRECSSPNWDTGTDDCFVVPAGFYCGWAERKKNEGI